MQPDPARLADTREWLIRASRDLRAALHDLSAVPPLLDAVVFHCQQAAEKALKAFLAWHDVPFHRTHSLEELGRQCTLIDPSLLSIVELAAPMTDYAWKYRYPGDAEEPSSEETADAIELATAVLEAVIARLPDEVRP